VSEILITGASGLLGSTLVPYLKNIKYDVATHSRTGDEDFLFDLTDREKSFKMLNFIQPKIIINLTSLTDVDMCQNYPNMAYLSNVRTVENIANWINTKVAPCHLIHISTDHVYDGEILHHEDEITLSNIYSFSKYTGELTASQVNSSILRTNFFGRSKTNKRVSLSDWVYNSLITGKPMQVLSDVFFSPLSISTLVKMIQLVVEKKPIGTFNVGSHDGMSKADFAFGFAECLKFSTETLSRIETSKAAFLKSPRPRGMRMDCSKFETTLGVNLPQLSDEIQHVAKEYINAT
jgi:dTDP-4-dehydrorhamnose reductase